MLSLLTCRINKCLTTMPAVDREESSILTVGLNWCMRSFRMVSIINSDDSDDEPEQLQYKVIVLGDGAVGKTSLAMRFTGDFCRKR